MLGMQKQLLLEGIFSRTTAPNATVKTPTGKGSRPSLRSERIQNATDGELAWILKNGNPYKGMPIWAGLPEQERWQIMAYLRSLKFLARGGTEVMRQSGSCAVWPLLVGLGTVSWDSRAVDPGERSGCSHRSGCDPACGLDWRGAVSGYPVLGVFLRVDDRRERAAADRRSGSGPGADAERATARTVCRAIDQLPSCHFVTEFQGVTGAGNRTYSDFTTRSPIPRLQPNGFDHTPRNSMQMVDSFTSRSGPALPALRWRVRLRRRPGGRDDDRAAISAGCPRSTTMRSRILPRSFARTTAAASLLRTGWTD